MSIDLESYKRDRAALESVLREHGAVFKGKECACPFHEDRNPSAGIFEDKNGNWQFKCQSARCGVSGDIFEIQAIIKGVTSADIIRELGEATRKPAIKAPTSHAEPRTTVYPSLDTLEVCCGLVVNSGRWEYVNPDTGETDLVVYRKDDKDGKKKYIQVTTQTDGFVMKGLDGVKPLYNRTGIKSSNIVLFVEGEKCVDLLKTVGVPATTLPGGSGASKNGQFDLSPLKGKTVYLWPDNDIPDANGKSGGIEHMKRIAAMLENLHIEAHLIDIAGLGLPPKGDIEQFLERHPGTPAKQKAAVWRAMQNYVKTGAHHEMIATTVEIGDGVYSAAPMPWENLHQLARFATPGMVSIFVGEAGSGKSFFLIQCAAHWYEKKIPFAFYALEDPRDFHVRRALAQKLENSKYANIDWIEENHEEMVKILEEHQEFINNIGKSISGETLESVTKGGIIDWVNSKVDGGAKVIIIDPITMTKSAGGKPWTEDEALMDNVKRIAMQRKVSIILATHPSKDVVKPDDIHMSNIAGGAAISRFAHKIIWLQPHFIPTTSTVSGPTMTRDIKHNRTFHILKSRDTPGQGMRIAMDFCPTLCFQELGVILSKNNPKSKNTPQSDFGGRAKDNIGKKKPYATDRKDFEDYEDDGIPFD
jgi:hypothetical protein